MGRSGLVDRGWHRGDRADLGPPDVRKRSGPGRLVRSVLAAVWLWEACFYARSWPTRARWRRGSMVWGVNPDDVDMRTWLGLEGPPATWHHWP